MNGPRPGLKKAPAHVDSGQGLPGGAQASPQTPGPGAPARTHWDLQGGWGVSRLGSSTGAGGPESGAAGLWPLFQEPPLFLATLSSHVINTWKVISYGGNCF